MTKIIGTVKEFKSMLEKIMCGSKYPLFPDVNLKIDQETIRVSCVDPTRAVATSQEYTGFHIEGSSDIPINTSSLYEAINLFNDSDSLTFEYEDNKIVLTVDSDGVIDIIKIAALDVNINEIAIKKINDLTYSVKENDMKFTAKVDLDVNYIKNQIKKANYINAAYHEYNIDIRENEIGISVGDIGSSTETIIKIKTTGIAKSQYCYGYDDIFKILSGKVSILINDDQPMIINQIGTDYVVNYLVAPIVQE